MPVTALVVNGALCGDIMPVEVKYLDDGIGSAPLTCVIYVTNTSEIEVKY